MVDPFRTAAAAVVAIVIGAVSCNPKTNVIIVGNSSFETVEVTQDGVLEFPQILEPRAEATIVVADRSCPESPIRVEGLETGRVATFENLCGGDSARVREDVLDGERSRG